MMDFKKVDWFIVFKTTIEVAFKSIVVFGSVALAILALHLQMIEINTGKIPELWKPNSPATVRYNPPPTQTTGPTETISGDFCWIARVQCKNGQPYDIQGCASSYTERVDQVEAMADTVAKYQCNVLDVEYL